MTGARTIILLFAATVLSGLLAGGVMDRVIVGGPAWHEMGAQAWLQYSRHADLGTGLIAYPIEGIGTAILIIAAIVSSYVDGKSRSAVVAPLYVAAFFSTAGLILTIKAAPIMLGLGGPVPTATVQSAFDAFFVWGLYVRGAADVMAFAALAWALSSAYQPEYPFP
jgi:hypothetical protein